MERNTPVEMRERLHGHPLGTLRKIVSVEAAAQSSCLSSINLGKRLGADTVLHLRRVLLDCTRLDLQGPPNPRSSGALFA